MATGVGGANLAQNINRALMVGFQPQDTGIKQIKQEEPHTTSLQSEDEEEQPAPFKSPSTSRGGQTAATAQQHTPDSPARLQQRRISLQDAYTPVNEKPEEDENHPAARPTQGQRTVMASDGTVIKMDTAAYTQWKFNMQQQAAGANGMLAQQPEVKKREFLKNLQQMVKDEYAQYVKSDDAPYSRRNLREIMQALNQESPSAKRLRKETDSRNVILASANSDTGEFRYNKLNFMRAANTLKVVQQFHDEPAQNNLLMVA